MTRELLQLSTNHLAGLSAKIQDACDTLAACEVARSRSLMRPTGPAFTISGTVAKSKLPSTSSLCSRISRPKPGVAPMTPGRRVSAGRYNKKAGLISLSRGTGMNFGLATVQNQTGSSPKLLAVVIDGPSYRWIARDLGASTNAVGAIVVHASGPAPSSRRQRHERASSGLGPARAEGGIGGHRRKPAEKQRGEISESIVSGSTSGVELARLYGVGDPTVSRIIPLQCQQQGK